MIKINTVITIEKYTQTQHLDMNKHNRFLNLEFIKDNKPLKKAEVEDLLYYVSVGGYILEPERISHGIWGYFSFMWKQPAKVCKKG